MYQHSIDHEGTYHHEGETSNWKPIPRAEAVAMVKELQRMMDSSIHGHGRTRVSSFGDVVLTRLQFMAGTLNLMVEMNKNLVEASQTAAAVFLRGPWAARQVCKWIRAFQVDQKLPTNLYSNWNGSVMEDKDLSAAIQEWLRQKGKYIQA
jgi:hypothetical protein